MRRYQWMRIFVVISMTLAIAGTGQSQDKAVYAPKNGRFTIVLPDGELSGERVKLVPLGPAPKSAKGKIGPAPRNLVAPIESSQSKVKDGTVFTGASIGIPAVIVREIPEEKRHGAYRDLVMKPNKGPQGTLASEKDIKQGDWSGKEYVIDFPKTKMRMQLFMDGGFGFFAAIEADNAERLNAKDAQEFFASFKLKKE